MTFHKQLFNRQALRVGWSMLWRIWLAVLALKVAFSLPVGFWYALRHASASDPAALRAHFDRILDISNLPVLLALIPTFNWIGKSVLRKRNLAVPSGFIGWTIFWRVVGLSIFLILGIAVAILLPIVFLIHSKMVGAVATLLFVASMFACVMFSYGWATLRVSRAAESALHDTPSNNG